MTHTSSSHPRLSEATALLQRLIATPSPSREEACTADIWYQWMLDAGCTDTHRLHNNVWTVAPGFHPGRPTLMLNSHHDTVRPASSYTRPPYSPDIVDDRLYGLGSNDAGASCVSLAYTFLDFCSHATELPFNLILAITAAEEVMAPEGMRALLPHLTEIGMRPDMVIVGEPTGMLPAIGERGLVVLDGVASGISGHAARHEGINALYRAIDDINRLRRFTLPRQSRLLGPVSVNVTMINAGSQHNVVPDHCTYVVDVRTTDAYSNADTVELLRTAVAHSILTPRSTHIQASALSTQHPLYKAAVGLGLEPFVSPTTSDMALMQGIPALKIGPGQSARSHTADEYVLLSEISHALHLYPRLIKHLTQNIPHSYHNGKTTLE